MTQTIINTIVTGVISAILGYCISLLKNYKKRLEDKEQETEMVKEAMLTMLQSNLTNTYYVYENQEEIPDYVYKNWLNSLKIYEKLGGDDYIHVLADKMKKWDFTKTDILKKGGK